MVETGPDPGVGEILVQDRAAPALRCQPQDRLAAEPLGQRRPLAPPAPRAHPDEGLVEEVPVLEAARRVLPRHHREVDVTAHDEAHALA